MPLSSERGEAGGRALRFGLALLADKPVIAIARLWSEMSVGAAEVRMLIASMPQAPTTRGLTNDSRRCDGMFDAKIFWGALFEQLFLAIDQFVDVVGGELKFVSVGDRVGGAGFHAVAAENAA